MRPEYGSGPDLRVRLGALDAQDLGQRGAPDLELALVGLARADEALDLEARALERAGERRAGVALGPREDLDGGRRGGERDRAAGERAGLLHRRRSSSVPARLAASIGATRCEPQRSCSLAASRGVVVVGLVGADRLVLDAVVGGELAAAQGEQRGHERDGGRGGLAAGAAHAAAQQRRRPATRRPRRPSTPASWNGSRASGSAALDERDDGQRLGQAHDAAHAGHRVGGAQPRLAAGGGLDVAGVGAHGRRPVRRAVDQQPVAQRHAAQPQLPVGVAHPSSLLGRSAKNSAAKPRSRTSMRSSAECISGHVS